MALAIRAYRSEDRAATALIRYRAIMDGTTGHLGEPERGDWARSSEPDWSKPDKLLTQWCWIEEENGQPTASCRFATTVCSTRPK
jgi:hypothetical protein